MEDGTVKIEQLQELELRVAEVLEVKDHPDADKLYVLTISLGEEKRQIVAGLRGYYSVEDLLNRQIVVAANLEHAVIRGERSEGMLLAADNDGRPVILGPVSAVPPGTAVR